MKESDAAMTRAIELVSERADVTTLWLYGSRARGEHARSSDYDLAVTFARRMPSPIEAVTRIEALRSSLQQLFKEPVSLVELDRAPTPLAASIAAEGLLLIDRTPVETGWLCQRIWSKWDDWCFRRRAEEAA
jgi:predicted nucleotidyltransferase